MRSNWFNQIQTGFLICNFTVIIPIEIIPGQKLMSQIWQPELLIEHYSEITEPENVFGMQLFSNFKTWNMAQSLSLQH